MFKRTIDGLKMLGKTIIGLGISGVFFLGFWIWVQKNKYELEEVDWEEFKEELDQNGLKYKD